MTGFLALLGLTRAGFTAPSFAIFTDLLTGWVCAPGRRTITRVIAVADPTGRRAHDAYHRFVRDGAWSMHRLWQVLAARLLANFCPKGIVELACDDTLFNHQGPKVEGAGIFRDAVRSTLSKVVYGRGLNLVVITLIVHPPWGGMPIAVPVNMRVHKKKDPVTTIEHAAAMLRQIADWFPERHLHLVADGAYATLAGAHLPRTDLTCRMRRDAALYAPAPPRTGKRGRPRSKGERLPTPTELSKTLPKQAWTQVQIDVRGKSVTRLVHVRDLLWYRVNNTDLLRLVILRDPEHVEPDDYFFTTELTATAVEVASRYATRWAIEVCFRDVKQDLGGQDPQSWKRRGPERAAALSVWLHAAIWCWYLTHHPDGKSWTPRPWYPAKATPSFLDALAALRKVLWAQRITAMSRSEPENTIITEAILDTLAYAA